MVFGDGITPPDLTAPSVTPDLTTPSNILTVPPYFDFFMHIFNAYVFHANNDLPGARASHAKKVIAPGKKIILFTPLLTTIFQFTKSTI